MKIKRSYCILLDSSFIQKPLIKNAYSFLFILHFLLEMEW